MAQVIERNRIARIFLDPLKEKHLEGEAILIERLSSTYLDGNLYWERWKVKFLEDEEDEEDEVFERFILACYP